MNQTIRFTILKNELKLRNLDAPDEATIERNWDSLPLRKKFMRQINFLKWSLILLLLVFSFITVITGHQVRAASLAAAIPPRPDPVLLRQTLDRGDITGAIRLVETGWKQQYEAYYEGRLTSNLVEAPGISRILQQNQRQTQRKAALVYAIATPQALELILLPAGSEPVHRRVAVDRKTLLQAVQTFRMGVVNPESDPEDYLPAARQLYQWLLSPLEPILQAQQVQTLVFCLGGGLRSLPIAALHNGRQFLAENYSLAIIPAFNLLDPRPATLHNIRVLAMGQSEFRSQPPLPAVPVELQAITRNLWPGEAWLNQEFTLAGLKARRASYPFGIIHLATHAKFLPGSVDQSYIQFWDGQLRPDQFRSLGLRRPAVQLLVLSACQTALGDPQAELGFAGLAVMSGSKAAMASLWSVSDGGTLALMTEFYRYLKTAPTKAEALRQAQLALLRQPHKRRAALLAQLSRGSELATLTGLDTANLSHPYYWAAFTLIGNPW